MIILTAGSSARIIFSQFENVNFFANFELNLILEFDDMEISDFALSEIDYNYIYVYFHISYNKYSGKQEGIMMCLYKKKVAGEPQGLVWKCLNILI